MSREEIKCLNHLKRKWLKNYLPPHINEQNVLDNKAKDNQVHWKKILAIYRAGIFCKVKMISCT